MKIRLNKIVIWCAIIVALVFGCSKPSSFVKANPLYVIAHTDGIIERDNTISVVLAHAPETGLGSNPFTFEPALEGTVHWSEDGTRIDFKPKAPLSAGKKYLVTFDFKKLGVPDRGHFNFAFRVALPDIAIVTEPELKAKDAETMTLTGAFYAYAIDSSANIERLVTAKLGNKSLVISWSHPGDNLHVFTIKEIERTQKEQKLHLTIDARKVQGKFVKKISFPIPEKGRFSLLAVKQASTNTGNAVTLTFTEPIKKNQDLRGFIDIKGVTNLRYEIDENIVRVYSDIPWPETTEVTVNTGIQSISNNFIATKVSATATSQWDIPSLRFENSAVIIPTTQGTKIVLKTKNLSKVYIEVLHIYGSNMIQFLQVNELSGSQELRRVGDVIWQKTVDLPWDDSMKNQEVSHVIDLGPILTKNPGGMYQIRATYTHECIRYQSPNTYTSFGNWKFPPILIDNDDEQSYWNYYENYYGEYSGFNYSEYQKYSNDPVHPSFYYRHITDIIARRNVLVSDVGLNVKRETDGTIHVFASDLKTAKPLPGLSISVYSFSSKLLASGTIDKNGFAILKPQAEFEPAFIIARGPAGNTQNGYLKLSKPLAASHFEIGGEKPEQGLKGFIYTERGIWRPGDDIHLVFILQDTAKKIPANHPVEFKLINPRGQNIQSAVLTKSVNGFYYFKTGTASDAITGNYVAQIKVGNAVFTKTLKIESIMPNRLKTNINFGSINYVNTKTNTLSFEAQWLHGAPAQDMRADVSVQIALDSNYFITSYPDYKFYSPTTYTSSEKDEIWNGYLDSNGKKEFSVNFSDYTSISGPCKAYFFTRVFEESGIFSSEVITVPFHPFEQYVGIKLPQGDKARNMLLTDKNYQVELLLLDTNGKLVPSGSVEVELYMLTWRWWFEKSRSEETEIASSEIKQIIDTKTVPIANGKGIYTLHVKYSEWGRFLVLVRDTKSGHVTGKEFYMGWPGWAGKGRENAGDSAMTLSFSADKDLYKIGEKVQIRFPSNKDSSAYITIEKSGKVLKEEWLPTTEGSTTYTFTVTADMAPNVYVHITYIQPHLQTKNDLPIRLYGITPVMVENPLTRLDPRISAPDTLEPLKKAQFTVYEQNGRAMTYTVAVVDEGLLGLTKFSIPNPWNTFYKKEASLVTSYDIYRDVANAFSSSLQSFLTIGGGDSVDTNALKKPNRFPPIVQFYGPFTLERGQRQTHEIELGQYVGAVRFMLVAGTLDSAYGAYEKEVQVKSSLMTFITAPRFIAPKERMTIPVTVFSYLGENAQVSLSLNVKGPGRIVGSNKQTLIFPQDGDLLANFDVQLEEQEGTLTLEAVAVSPSGKSAIQTINIPVQSPSIVVTTATQKLIGGKSSITIDHALPGIPGSNSAWLELSVVPPINLSSHLQYLIGYPHGCGEQRTSKMFPQLFLPGTVNLSKKELDTIRNNITNGINDLQLFQKSSGGFVFWQGSWDESTWLTAYIAHFLFMAQKAGYVLPSSMLEKALGFLTNKVKQFNVGTGTIEEHYYYGMLSEQSYVLYVLALAGKADIGGLNRLSALEPAATTIRLQLAAAYAYAGVKNKAQEILAKTKYNVVPGTYYEYTYGSSLREQAMVLDCLNALGDTANALPIYKQIVDRLSNRKYFSTQELAFSLIAVQPYIQNLKKDKVQLNYQEKNGQLQTIELAQALIRIPLSTADSAVSVSINNPETVHVYARIIASGRELPGKETKLENGLKVSVSYYDTNNRVINPGDGYRGQDMIVQITVKNTLYEKLTNVAVTYRLPSGWEILNQRLAETELEKTDSYFYKDIRDDRVMFYTDLNIYEEKTFIVMVNRTYGGQFYLPAVTAEAMYKPEVLAVLPGLQLPLITAVQQK